MSEFNLPDGVTTAMIDRAMGADERCCVLCEHFMSTEAEAYGICELRFERDFDENCPGAGAWKCAVWGRDYALDKSYDGTETACDDYKEA